MQRLGSITVDLAVEQSPLSSELGVQPLEGLIAQSDLGGLIGFRSGEHGRARRIIRTVFIDSGSFGSAFIASP